MPRGLRWSLEELAVWAQWGHAPERISDLLRPQDFAWPESPGQLEPSCAAVRRALGARLVDQALAGAVLAPGRTRPDWALDWCRTQIRLADLGLPFDWRVASSMPWILVPLALAGQGIARICWCLAGLLPSGTDGPCTPEWWERVTDDEARAAAFNATELLQHSEAVRMFIWPFLANFKGVQLRGPSLGLPLVLAGLGLKRSLKPPEVLVTGALDRDGRLLPVEHLDAKARLAASEGFAALLAPVSPGLEPRRTPDVELLTVVDLQEAACVWQAYTPGGGTRLLQQIRCIGEPDWLAAGAHLLSSEVLRLPGIMDRYARALEVVLANRSLILPFLDNLERLVEAPDACLGALTGLLQAMGPDRVLELGARLPLDGYRLAQVRLTCANHCGNPAEASRWVAVSRQLEPFLGVYEQELALTTDRLNRQFVAERHNRYDFREDIPEEMGRSLAELQELHAIRRRRHPEAVCPPLGRMYGTLAQNAGFCGPDHLATVLERVALAQEAFGLGTVPEYRNDWQRQFPVLVYAHLDAMRRDEAAEALAAYLGSPLADLRTRGGFERLNPYQHAALARYLADTGTPAPEYMAWAVGRVGLPARQHPWQLWASNVGDLSRDPDVRKRLWTLAVECCLAQAGPTAQVMALAPLSKLWMHRLAPADWVRKAARLALRPLEGESLCRDHFRPLLGKSDRTEVLEALPACRGRLFPFSYR